MGKIFYRAIHTKNLWRKVNNHKSIKNAIEGKDGAAGLFAHKARIDYDKQGEPRYVIVWEEEAKNGFIIKSDPERPNGIRKVSAPIANILSFERNDQADVSKLEEFFQ